MYHPGLQNFLGNERMVIMCLESAKLHWRASLAGKKAPYSLGRGPGVHETP